MSAWEKFTIEQLMKIAEEWQEQLIKAEQEMALAECSSPKWCSAFRKMNESKIALEELQGWTERIGSFT